MPVCIDLMAQAMQQTAQGETLQPPRWIMGLPGDSGRGFGLMPGAMKEPAGFGSKLTAVYPENGAKGLQSHRGIIALFDTETGAPVAAPSSTKMTVLPLIGVDRRLPR